MDRQQAIAELYDRYADRLHHFLVVRLGSRSAADDVLQEVFLRIVRHREKLDQADNPLSYAFTIARNEALRYQRRNRRQTAGTPSADDLYDTTSDNRDEAEAIAAALTRLSDDEREVVELKVYGGLVLREIADVTGAPQGTVASRWRTALARLKEQLERCLK